MVPADEHHRPLFSRDRFDFGEKQILGLRTGKIGIENIAGNQTQFHFFPVADLHDFIQHGGLLFQAFPPHQTLADVPIRRMQNPHARCLRARRPLQKFLEKANRNVLLLPAKKAIMDIH